jgi:hypothetical protein
MNTPAASDSAGLFDGPQALARPYPGGRAQAESGSKIIENDYLAWKIVCIQPYRLHADHPLLAQFTDAWGAVSALGLSDDAGAASIRYRVLARAARCLMPADGGREAQALLTLRRHASTHGDRLYATAPDQFLSSGASGQYDGFAQAAVESADIEKRYQAWREALAEIDPGLAGDVTAIDQAWVSVEEHGLMDGPGRAAGRYRALSDHARGVTDDLAPRLPSDILTLLLELALHADKHSIRLHNTATAIKSGTVDRSAPYRGLPLQVAAATVQAHTDIPRGGRASALATGATAPSVPTPGTLGVCGVPGYYRSGVPCWSLGLVSWCGRRSAGMVSARVPRRGLRAVPRSAAPAGGAGCLS